MSDETKVIAETADYELLDDGCLLVKYEGARNVELRDFPLLLADLARRRVRKELGQYRLEQIVELTDRIEAVEKAIQDTRVDQGEMGLVTECQEKNILRKIEGLADRLAAVENRAACADSRSYAANRRLDALEARQQDEVGEDEYLQSLPNGTEKARQAIRRELAREIVERLREMRRGELVYDPTLVPDMLERRVADWIEREYLGGEGAGVESEAP